MTRQLSVIASVAMSLALLGCGNTDANDIQSAQAAVSQKLKDPASAQYGKAFVVASTESSEKYSKMRFVCGDVNAKNSLGGYIGATRFTVLLAEPANGGPTQVLYTEMEGRPDDLIFSQVWWSTSCKPSS